MGSCGVSRCCGTSIRGGSAGWWQRRSCLERSERQVWRLLKAFSGRGVRRGLISKKRGPAEQIARLLKAIRSAVLWIVRLELRRFSARRWRPKKLAGEHGFCVLKRDLAQVG